MAAFVRRLCVTAKPAGDVGPEFGTHFFRRFFGQRGRGRCAGRTGAGKVLTRDPVVVAVEVVRVARQQVFLGFGLVGEVGAVVVERLRRGRGRLQRDDAGAERDEEGETLDGADRRRKTPKRSGFLNLACAFVRGS
jgi:hypothetical protein